MSIAGEQAAPRLLRFVSGHGPCMASPMAGGPEGQLLLTGRGGKRCLAMAETVQTLVSGQLLSREGGKLQLSPLGKKHLKRMVVATLDDPGGFAGQHRTVVQREIRIDGAAHAVAVNTDESPLARLSKRRDGHGRPWIDDTAFQAGERLRRDFTIGGLMQKVTASWDIALGGAGRKANAGSSAGTKADLTDSAIDARRRLDDALDIVGPDLAGVLTDFCCFLKGLESIERERKWPPRSAKLMLRTGLELLARFYGLEARSGARGKMQSWGGEGYRPMIGDEVNRLRQIGEFGQL